MFRCLFGMSKIAQLFMRITNFTIFAPSFWTSGIIDHTNQRDGRNCGVIVLKEIFEK